MSDTTPLSKVTIDQGFTKVDKKAIEDLYWRDALTWAQESLICRDTFNQLATDAVHLKQRMSTFRDGVLIISLHDDYLLKVEIKHYPFKAGDLPEEGDAYLNRALRQMVVTQHSQRLIRSQMFVELPLTTMNEQLDMRGPNALTQQEIDERGKKPASLLEKLLLVSSHHRLVQLTVETLKMFQAECSDPQIKWRWLRCTPTNSQALVHITDPQFDFLMGKVTFYVKVTTDCISVVNKEGHAIDCYRDQDRLLNSLKYMNSNFFLNATANLGKIAWTYQILHGNNNAMDVHGNPAPTLYFSNPSSTRAILIQFHINQDPEISVKKQTVDESAPFIKLVYKKLPGKSLCKKMDNLFAILRE